MNRRGFLITSALGAAAAAGLAAVEAEPATVTITLDTLRSWGACARWIELFPKRCGESVTGTAAEIAAIPTGEYDQLWILQALAVHVDGDVGRDALALLVPRADASRLARAVVEVNKHDTTAALARLVELGEPEFLGKVVEDGGESDAATAAAALAVKATAAQVDVVEETLSVERKALLASAREVVK